MDISITKPITLEVEVLKKFSHEELLDMAQKSLQTQLTLNLYSHNNNWMLSRIIKTMETKKKEKEEMLRAVAQLGKASFQTVEVFHPTRSSGLW